MSLVNAFGALALDQTVQEVRDQLASGNTSVVPTNVQTEFRESFETYNTSTVWAQTVGSGDIVQLDGNAASASYLVISKDPLTAGNETIVETRAAFTGPFETSVGLSMSQRVLGQETSIELVSTDTPLPPVEDIALSSISQSATTLIVTTASPHNLSAGQRVGIYGVTSDSRMNYPSLVVSYIVSATQFYCASTPGGAITSLTVGPYANQGFVYRRPSLGGARDGASEIFENASTTNASLYVRADSGDALPSGSAGGNHSVTIGTSTPAQLINAAYTYSFNPTTEYKLQLQTDKVSFFDYSVDTSNQPSTRLNRNSVVPSVAKTYKLRFRCTNNKGLPVPNAKIVSAVKSASAIVTITTDAPHGLTTGDFVSIFGIGDTTNFPNQTGQTGVSSTPTNTTFTVTLGSSATATSAGGLVARAQGSQTIQGVSTTVIAQASSTSTELTLIGSASWSFSIGDYVNVYGLRNRATGADMGFDGAYKVVNQASSTLTLQPLTGTTLPAPLTLTNTGGAVIKRTDSRISYARIFQYFRERVEVLNKSDSNSGVPVQINGGVISSGNITAFTPINTIVNDIASGAITTTQTSAAITPTASGSTEFNMMVTAVSGTNQTLDFVVQESDDSGTNWYDIYHFPRITAVGQYRSPLIPLTGNRVRYLRTVGGTSPSFTNAVNRLVVNTPQPLQRQFFDRALVINTINSVTPSYFVEGCADLNVLVSMGAVTTAAPVLVLEVSPDNATWIQVGADITTAANTNNLLQVTDALGRFARIRVKTAGSGATLGFLMVKGIGR